MNGVYLTKIVFDASLSRHTMKLIIALYKALWFCNQLLPMSFITQLNMKTTVQLKTLSR